jgi:uncharacterized integral membrane protein
MPPEKSGISKPKLIVVAVALVIAVILILQNTEHVETHILFARVTMPRAVLLVVAAGVGFVAGWLTARLRRGKR